MGQVFFYLDEDGQKQDAQVHEPILDNEGAELLFVLQVLRDHVEEGNTPEDAIARFAPEGLRTAWDAGEVTWENILSALEEEESEDEEEDEESGPIVE